MSKIDGAAHQKISSEHKPFVTDTYLLAFLLGLGSVIRGSNLREEFSGFAGHLLGPFVCTQRPHGSHDTPYDSGCSNNVYPLIRVTRHVQDALSTSAYKIIYLRIYADRQAGRQAGRQTER